MIITIQDPGKGVINYNTTQGIEFEEFSSHLKKNKCSLRKVADIVPSGDSASDYTYVKVVPNSTWNKGDGWVYTMVVNGRICKIGMTEKTLQSRFSSYQAGTLKARKKGTCSVTNYYCSEFIRQCHNKGLSVELYAHRVPEQTVNVTVLGASKPVSAKCAYVFEEALLSEHHKLKGELPPLCRNSSLT